MNQNMDIAKAMDRGYLSIEIVKAEEERVIKRKKKERQAGDTTFLDSLERRIQALYRDLEVL